MTNATQGYVHNKDFSAVMLECVGVSAGRSVSEGNGKIHTVSATKAAWWVEGSISKSFKVTVLLIFANEAAYFVYGGQIEISIQRLLQNETTLGGRSA